MIPNEQMRGKRRPRRGPHGEAQVWEGGAGKASSRRAEPGQGLAAEAGPAVRAPGAGVRSGKAAPRGLGRGLGGPAPRAGSQWARRRRVTEGAEVRVPRRQRRRTARPERGGLAEGAGARGRRAGDPGTREAARPGPPEERRRPGGGAMPLAQLKEPWPLMELVPLDPEVSERGGGRAPAAGEPGSPRGRGGSRRRCSLAGALEGASALRSLALPRLHPPCPGCECVREGQFRQAPRTPLARRGGSRGALGSGWSRPTHLRPVRGAVGASSVSADGQGCGARCLGFYRRQGSWEPHVSLTSPSALPRELPASLLLTLAGLPLSALGSCGIWGDTTRLGLKLLVFLAPGLGPEDTCVPYPRLWRRDRGRALRPCEDYPRRQRGPWCLPPFL